MEEQKRDTKKKTSIVTWLVLVVFVIIIAVVIDTASNAEPKATSNAEPSTEHEAMDISVTSQNIKEVDGKYRYFFDIRNNDDRPFTGDINIDLISAEGKSIYAKDFQNASIDAGIGKSVYIDISTGPVQVHGANGIQTYEYTARVKDDVVKTGSESISTTLE